MRGEKNGEKSEWLYGLLNPKSNIIVRAPLLSSCHQILLLVLIENPWGPSWKQCSALEKWYKKCLCPSYQNVVSEVCSTSTPSSIMSAEKTRERERGWREFIDNFTFVWNDCDHGGYNRLLETIRAVLVASALAPSLLDLPHICCCSVCFEACTFLSWTLVLSILDWIVVAMVIYLLQIHRFVFFRQVFSFDVF